MMKLVQHRMIVSLKILKQYVIAVKFELKKKMLSFCVFGARWNSDEHRFPEQKRSVEEFI
jgi:hypothetical protein